MPEPNNSFATASVLPLSPTSQLIADGVSTIDLEDFYRFTLTGRSSLNLTLGGLSGNADLRLLDSTGALVQQSVNQATLPESLNRVLGAGTYYLQVSLGAGSASANYSLNFQAQSNPSTGIVWRNYASGENRVWQIDSSGAVLSNTGFLEVSDPNWRIEATGDFSSDGNQDLVWRNAASGDIRIWTMDGATLISISGSIGAVADPWRIQGTGDLNGDGHTDLVWRNAAAGQNVVWLMNGTSLAGVTLLPEVVGANWQIQGVGDFNGDHQSDLVWRDYATGANVVWLMNGTSLAAIAALPTLGDLNYQLQGVGDFTGDGRPDLFWRNGISGENSVWVLDGTAISSSFLILAVTDTNWRATAPLTGFAAPISIDVAGNALESAFNIGTLNGYGVYQDTVSSTDPDFYKFSLTQTGRVNLAVYGSAAVNGALINYGGFTPHPVSGKRLSQVLNPGTYYIQVGSGDLNNYTLELSLAAMPTPPTQLDLVSASDSGVSQIDRVTKITTPVVMGLAEANTKVQVFNGATQLGEAVADGTGRWQITSSLVLAQGTYNLTARTLNALGDASADSAALAIAIDTQTAAPILFTPEFAPGNAAIIQGSAEAGALVQVFEGTQLLGTATASATGSWQLTSRSLDVGTYYFTAIATDIAGNISPQSLVMSWVVADSVLAAPLGLRLTAATDSGQSQTDNVTNNLSPTIAGTAPVGTTVRLFRNQQFLGQAPTDADGAWSLALTSPLPTGTYALSAIATSASGSSPAASLTVTIDPLVPTAEVKILADGGTTPVALANGAVLETGMRLVGQADGTLSAIASLRYKLGTNPEVAIAVTPEGLFNQLLDLTGVSGSQTLVITATDGAGNALPDQSYSVTVNPLPSNGLALLAQLTQDTGSDATDGWTSVAGVSGMLLSAQSPVTGLWGKFEGSAALQDLSGALSPNGSFVLSADQLGALAGGTLADGSHTLVLQGRTAANQTVEKQITFSLDTAAPELLLTSVEDGTAWERDTSLQGEVQEPNLMALAYQIVRESDGAAVAQNSLTVQASSTGATFDQVLPELMTGNTTLEEEEPYTLILTSTDRAGNSQRSSFQFFVPSDRLVEDDDLLVDEGGRPLVNPPDPVITRPTNPTVTTSGRYGGGGRYGYYGYSSGGIGSFTPILENATAPLPVNPLTGNGYEYDYVEGIGEIVKRAVNFISTAPQTLNEKAALKNRGNILSALGTRLNALIQPNFKEAKDRALIDQMQPVMAGLFVNAYDPQNAKAGVWDTTLDGYGARLAQQLVDDSLVNQVSIREQVFRATLMQVVTEVFWTKNITLSATEQAALAATVKDLAKTYAWLNPREEATVPDDQADYGFLDRLWQLQVPHLVLRGGKRVSEFKSAAVIQADLQKAVVALGRLLEGVDEPSKAIQFLSGLIQAETYVPSLKSSFKEAQFWRETVELGVTVAKLNPVTTEVTPDDAAGTFLNTLWRQGNTTAAQAGVGQFFGGLKTTQERVKSLEFADRLIDAAQLTTGLGDQKNDAKFLSQLVGLGGSYASLKPNLINPQDAPNLFLDTLWRGGSDEQTLSKASGELMQFLNELSTSTASQLPDRRLKLLQFEKNLLRTIKLASESSTSIQVQLDSTQFLSEILNGGISFMNLQSTLVRDDAVVDEWSNFCFRVWENKEQVGFKNAATLLQNGIQNEGWKNQYTSKNKGGFSTVEYDDILLQTVSFYNSILINGRPSVAKNPRVLDWLLVGAMMQVESSPGSLARRYDPLQVANQGDTALDTIRSGGESTYLITDADFRNSLRNVKKTQFDANGAPDYRYWSFLLQDEAITPKRSIEIAVPWLLRKTYATGDSGNIVGWQSWETGVQRYNGGGNPNYLSEVQAEYRNLREKNHS